MDDRTRDNLTDGIARICGDALGTAPKAVEVYGGGDLLLAVLRQCLPPAEEALGRRSDGRGLLQEYHDACSREILPALTELLRTANGRELCSAALEPVRGTRHKLLVLAFASPPGACAATTSRHPPLRGGTAVKSIAMLMGSPNDWPVMKKGIEVLQGLGVTFEVHVASAHRDPARVVSVVSTARDRGVAAVICGAGVAAHLAGVAAAHTTLPVIGVPLASGALNGQDALLSTVQMPRGIPVATVAIDGAANAALLACQILAVEDRALAAKLEALRAKDRQGLLDATEKYRAEVGAA